jgi:hypothetical protein
MSIQYTANQLQRKFSGPPGTPGFARLGEVLRTEGKLDEAIQLCQDGLRVRPYQLSGYLVLGKAYIDAGKLEEARQQFEDALKIDSRCLSAMRFLADIMNKLQWGDAATVYYRSILAVEPWDAEIRALMSGTVNPEVNPVATSAYSPEETFEKPEGMTGDVMEVDLSGIADFLPDDGNSTLLMPSNEDVSLEDALTPEPVESYTPTQTSATTFVPASAQEHVETEEKPPISGQDVEDRLASLFGSDDTFSDATSPKAEPWTPPEIPDRESTMSVAASATATDTFQPTSIIEDPLVANAHSGVAEDRVLGEDIEKRLDDLFSLTEEDKRSPTETSSFALPVQEIAEPGTREALPAELMSPSATASFEKAGETANFASAETQAVSQEDIVTSDDIGDRLDRLFGVEPEVVSMPQPEAESVIEEEMLAVASATWSPSEEETIPQVEVTESPKSWAEDLEQAPPDSSDIMSTESMLPVGWLEDAGEQPRITGADIEAQLDKLFDMEGKSDGLESGIRSKEELLGAEVSEETHESHEMPGEDPDQTLTMPVMRDKDFKPKSEDWLAREPGDSASLNDSNSIGFSSASETLMIPIDELAGTQDLEVEPDFDATMEISTGDELRLSDTASIEMIDGNDVSERLDELFTNEGTGVETTGMERPLQETSAMDTDSLSRMDTNIPVTGEEVASRLSEIFEDANETGEVTLEVPFNLEAAGKARVDTISQPLAPLVDEEDAYPEEEEMPPQTGAEGNVATVTLAEIYFNQGLKEQALQIYRQLLERESGNESVRKRISEIEASQTEGENRESDGQRPDSDSRRPRPGLKVPKRKK